MLILGISCFYHDSAACLIQDGKIIAAAEEERFTRIKNDASFPFKSIEYCTQFANIIPEEIDYIGFYEKPYLKFSRIIIDHLRNWPFSYFQFIDNIPYWLQDRLILPIILKKELCYTGNFLTANHHLTHAASSFLVSPFDEAAIIVADAVGEWSTLSHGLGMGNNIKMSQTINYPDSLGLLYSTITTFLGFQANRGEGSVMGLAAYGDPKYYLKKLRQIINIKQDGSFKIDSSYFHYIRGRQLFSPKLIKLFGNPRNPIDPISNRDCDIAAALQSITEEILIKIAQYVYKKNKINKLCLAGGVFLNCITNHKLLEQTDFQEIFIQPATGDTGGSLGIATYINNVLLDNPREIIKHTYLGPSFSNSQIERTIVVNQLKSKKLENDSLSKYIAQEISKNKIIGYFQGRMEFGPRALGHRSILANPCNPQMKDILNKQIKNRESFRPYAPIVLQEHAHKYFDLLAPSSPFMLLAPKVNQAMHMKIPAVTHEDGTARIQTIDKKIDIKLYQIIEQFNEITGIPMIINTSLNLKGEPIACTPDDAISIFRRSKMDILVLENHIIEKYNRYE